ncbi:MAG TPA: helix-turn-helix domain-containing protein [Ktedonobacteraceae bacterium]|nr:helix-turn-helix domain-containing protein [Ktedonobacteraceae bacterium]
MPKHLQARAAQDEREERQVRKLARSLHAPADWKFHAHMVVESWAGKTPQEIATTLSCHPRTVCIHLNRFNAQGTGGLGMREGAGRKPRLSEQERSRILALVKQPPPGKLERYADGSLNARKEEGSAQWSLDALTDAAHAAGNKARAQSDPTHLPPRRQALAPPPKPGEPAMTGSSPQKNGGRHPLHRAAQRIDDHLHRRTRTGDPTHLCAGA